MYKKILLTVLTFLMCFQAFASVTYGSVSAVKTNIYEKPSAKSEITGLLGRGETVTILDSRSGWLKIQLPEKKTGYVKAANVKKTEKKPEDTQIDRMLEKFNKTVLESDYAQQKKVVPSLTVSGKNGDFDITLLYSAVNEDGKKIPSLMKNPLEKNMRELIELSFLKMLKKPSNVYKITVETPFFGENGVINGSTQYAVFTISAENQQIKNIEEGKISVWNLVKSSKKLADVFTEYPH